MATQSITVPLDTIVPISKFGRAGASGEFAKVEDDTPGHRAPQRRTHLFHHQRARLRIYRQALIECRKQAGETRGAERYRQKVRQR